MKFAIVYIVFVSVLSKAQLDDVDDVFPYECYFADINDQIYLRYTCKFEAKSRRQDCQRQADRSSVHMIEYLCESPLDSLKLYAKMFNNLKNAQVLNTSYLKISSITPMWSESSQFFKNQIITWNAVHNELTEIPISVLDWMPKLREVNFSYNKIRALNFKNLKDTNVIWKVNCSHNEIGDISTEAFSTISRLVINKFRFI